MREVRTVIALAAAAALVVGCTSSPPPSDGDGGAPATDALGGLPAGLLVVSTETGDASIESGSGALVAGGGGTVATPDGASMFRATSTDGSTTVISTIDPRTGETGPSLPLRGRLGLAVASVSGRMVALVGAEPGAPTEVTPGLPVPRSTTPIVVADPSGASEPRRFDLDGNFEPEAFSVDDDRLFLLQYLPAEAPAVYRVVVLDLATGEVEPVAGRFKTPPQRMPGVRLAQVYDPARAQLYTLYSNRPGAYATGYASGGGSRRDWPEETFVHVLNLRRGWAYCAGLPDAMWDGTAREQALAPSPDSRALYVVDAQEGLVAVMDTRSLEVERTARVSLEAGGSSTAIAVSRDGATLYVASSSGTLTAIDADTLSAADRWATPIPVTGLGTSLDGRAVYAAGAGRLSALDAVTGAAIATVPTEGLGSVLALEPLPAA
jgi:DNA-binding beta-propeller fold protein YncE